LARTIMRMSPRRNQKTGPTRPRRRPLPKSPSRRPRRAHHVRLKAVQLRTMSAPIHHEPWLIANAPFTPMLSGSRRRSPLMASIIRAATDTDSSRVRPSLQSLPDHDVRRRRRLTQLFDPRLPLNGGQAGLVAGLRRAPATARLHLVPGRLLESTRAQSFRRRQPSARCRVSSRPDHASPAAHARTPRAARCAACSRSTCCRAANHSSTASVRSYAEKNVAKSSTLAGVRRASSSWAADAAVGAARRASLLTA
jgi:hypothetical protein